VLQGNLATQPLTCLFTPLCHSVFYFSTTHHTLLVCAAGQPCNAAPDISPHTLVPFSLIFQPLTTPFSFVLQGNHATQPLIYLLTLLCHSVFNSSTTYHTLLFCAARQPRNAAPDISPHTLVPFSLQFIEHSPHPPLLCCRATLQRSPCTPAPNTMFPLVQAGTHTHRLGPIVDPLQVRRGRGRGRGRGR